MTSIFYLPKRISTNPDGFATFHELHRHLLAHSDAQIDASALEFIPANLAAVLLALLDIHRDRHPHPLRDETLPERIHDILRRNAFLALYHNQSPDVVDERLSTIPLRRLEPHDADGFIDYLDRQLFGHHSVQANLDAERQAEFLGHYTEIFTNIEQHANTTLPVYTCGQYFPNDKKGPGHSKLAFTLVDRGQGFLKGIQQCDPTVTDGVAAIAWAASGRTTKSADHPGGRGLSSICNYCRTQGNAQIQIYSSGGFWQYDGQEVVSHKFDEPWLPLTVISLLFSCWQTTHPEGYVPPTA